MLCDRQDLHYARTEPDEASSLLHLRLQIDNGAGTCRNDQKCVVMRWKAWTGSLKLQLPHPELELLARNFNPPFSFISKICTELFEQTWQTILNPSEIVPLLKIDRRRFHAESQVGSTVSLTYLIIAFGSGSL